MRQLRADVGAMLREGDVPAPPFSGYAALSGAAPYRNRHTCVLLPIDAVLDALTAAKPDQASSVRATILLTRP